MITKQFAIVMTVASIASITSHPIVTLRQLGLSFDAKLGLGSAKYADFDNPTPSKSQKGQASRYHSSKAVKGGAKW